jgi:hypothetical protein
MTAGRAERSVALWDFAFSLLAVACVLPLFYVRYAPIQDLPQHLAAVRVLHDYHDPKLAFDRFFELHLGRTQYLAYYLAVDAMAYVLPLELANKLLVALSMIGIPYGARALLRALGKDGRLALLLFPLAYNAHLILGFINFIAAIALCLFGITYAVQQRRQYSRMRAVGIALICVICFYTHVVPFALMVLGIVLVSLSRDLRASALRLLPLGPAALAALVWLRASPAGQATLTAARGAQQGPRPQFLPAAYALHETPRWLTDVLAGREDLRLLEGWCALIALALVLACADFAIRLRASAAQRPDADAPDALARNLALRLLPLPPLCALLYFVAPTSYDWIWPIAQRFPLLAATFLVIALPRFRHGKLAVYALAIALSCASFQATGKAFAAFERDEVGDFDQALAQLPLGQRVVGLIFDRGSRNVAFSPFIHYVAYYQARKGGAVMFTFADFPQSPFGFRADNRPPPVPPRWEWMPERVRPTELGFYDYALVRGGPGAVARPNSGFVRVYRGLRWSVWKRAR